MKYTILMVLLVLHAPVLFAQSGTLIVTVSGMKELTGELPVGLYNQAAEFPKKGGEYRGEVRHVNNDTIQIVFKDLPKGEYALAVFHDLNSNKKLDTTLSGIPREPYVFSNQAKAKLGPPSFKKASFSVKDSTAVHLRLGE